MLPYSIAFWKRVVPFPVTSFSSIDFLRVGFISKFPIFCFFLCVVVISIEVEYAISKQH